MLLGMALAHLLLIWSGDILSLYAVVGMMLPLLRRLNDKRLLALAGGCILMPVVLDGWQEWTGTDIAAPLETAWWAKAHSLLYAVSALPMALAYMTGLCLLMLRYPHLLLFRWLAKPGRMALTNYISQSLVGIILYYGIGFGMGLDMGLW